METRARERGIVSAMDLATAVDASRSEGVRREATGLLSPSARPVSGFDWATAETTSHFALAERVARAGAGVLLIAVGAAELILGGWESGPWQRSVALVFAAAGALVLAQAVTNLVRRAARAGCAGNADAALGAARDLRRAARSAAYGRRPGSRSLVRAG